ncbi:O-antigen ligase family protein [Pseudomonas putida]|uniref:O-antigen ligase family protein n=1 Tax=Pseudomonas putida TaxID=303 RepID=UPI0023642D56|nr:O-antigen ligase family protein [Pseudomonas putida]MDD2101065.1 O-antigen ligase family protein [Pseudomonas putida]
MITLTSDYRLLIDPTKTAAFYAVFLIFPVYMIYQVLVQFRFIPPVFGSYFSVAAVLILPLSLWVVLKGSGYSRCFGMFYVKLLMLLVFMMCVLGLVGHFSGVNAEINSYHFKSALRFCSLFFVMFSFVLLSLSSRRLFFWFMVSYSVFICIFSVGGSFVYPAMMINGYMFELDYQQIALVYLIVLIMLLPECGAMQRFLLYVVTIPAMFLIGARSEFFAFFILVFIVEFVRYGARFIIFSYFALLATILSLFVFMSGRDFTEYRIFAIFSSDGDSSLNSRKVLQERAINTILEHPLMGAYYSHEPGAYAHSALAAWVDYGVLGFIILLVLVLGPFFSLMANFRRHYHSPIWIQAFSSISITIFMLIFAKSYTYSLVPVSIALYCIFRIKADQDSVKYLPIRGIV